MRTIVAGAVFNQAPHLTLEQEAELQARMMAEREGGHFEAFRAALLTDLTYRAENARPVNQRPVPSA